MIVRFSFATAALLGARSLLRQVARQAHRHPLATPFFVALTAGTILLMIFAELLGVSWASWTGDGVAGSELE